MNELQASRTRPLASLALCLALFWILAYVAFQMHGTAARAHDLTREEMLIRLGQAARTDLEETLRLHTEFAGSVARMLTVSPRLDRDQFARVTRSGDGWEYLVGVLYAQEVSGGRIEAWANRTRSAFPTVEPHGLSGEQTASLVHYLEPYDRLRSAHGLDLLGNPSWAASLTTARDSARVTATPPGSLEPLGIAGTGVLVIVPVFDTLSPGTSVAARRKAHLGYSVLVYDLPGLFREWRPVNRLGSGLAYRVVDITELGRPESLISVGSPMPEVELSQVFDIQVGDRRWHMVWEADRAFAAAGSRTPVVLLLLGLGGALTLCTLLYLLIIGNSRARSEVRVRTLQLEASEEEVVRTLGALREANERLRRMYEEKSEFLSTVSHELRTPLTVISEYVQMILSDQVGSIDDDAREFLAIAQHQLLRLNRMINELLDFARLEAGTLTLRPRYTEVGAVLSRMKSFFGPSASSAGIELAVAPCEEIPHLWIDPDRLEQVLGNLVSNSVKFTPAGGGVRVYAAYDGSDVEFLVEDDGPGISSMDQERLFDRFFQARVSANDGAMDQGTGLGLAIAKVLTELQGGEIKVLSEKGQGSCFVVRFPVLTEIEVEDLVRHEIAETAGVPVEAVFGRVGSLPAGGDGERLESWIEAHVRQDGACRIIRRPQDSSVLVLFGGPEDHLDAIASRSLAVFPLVHWEVYSFPRDESHHAA